MNYPVQILPQPIFKEITEDLPDYFLCRKVFDKNLLEDLSPIIKEELLGLETTSDCFDYSTNLPGVFQLDHNLIDLVGENKRHYRSYWDWISIIKEPVFGQDFLINENIGWYFLPISSISGITIPFSRKNIVPADETANALVLHTPTNCNYWHFSIRWHDGAAFISTNNSKWKNNIIATVRALFSEIIVTDYQPQKIEEEWYIKKFSH